MSNKSLSNKDVGILVPDGIQDRKVKTLRKRPERSIMPVDKWITELLDSFKDARQTTKRTELSIEKSMYQTREQYDKSIAYMERELKKISPSDERRFELFEQLEKMRQDFRDDEERYRDTRIDLHKASLQIPLKIIGSAIALFIAARCSEYLHSKQN